MKFFLTDATGIVSRPLMSALVKMGADVTILMPDSSNSRVVCENQPMASTVFASPLDTDALVNAMENSDVVVNFPCQEADLDNLSHSICIQRSKSIFAAAQKAGVKRFVQISSISAYGEPPGDRTYIEDSPRYASMAQYPSFLQEVELAILESQQQSTEVVVLQLGFVYGPGAGRWTDDILKTLSHGLFPLLDGGQGLCNLIHVNDAVEAIIKAGTVAGINHECFIITNDQPVRWVDFLRTYEQIVATKSLVSIPASLMRTSNEWTEYSLLREYRLGNKLLKSLITVLKFPYFRKPLSYLDNERIKFFTAKPYFSNQKAKKILGFSPKVDLEAGMRSLQAWFENTQLTKVSS